jgi:hypothetical protein
MSQTDASARAADANLREIVYLWFEVGSTHALMWIANPTGLHAFQPHVHLYLADRYGRLAVAYGRRARFATADRLAKKASRHFELGGGDAPPPAAALALGIPKGQVQVDVDALSDEPPPRGKVVRFLPKKRPGSLEPVGSDV